MPTTISAIPHNMSASIGMPARAKPVLRAIQNIGKCRSTPALTIAEPTQNASALRRAEKENHSVETRAMVVPWARNIFPLKRLPVDPSPTDPKLVIEERKIGAVARQD